MRIVRSIFRIFLPSPRVSARFKIGYQKNRTQLQFWLSRSYLISCEILIANFEPALKSRIFEIAILKKSTVLYHVKIWWPNDAEWSLNFWCVVWNKHNNKSAKIRRFPALFWHFWPKNADADSLFEGASLLRLYQYSGMPHVSLFQFFNIKLKYNFSFDGEFFHSAGSSKYSHRNTYGMANYKGKALTSGCGENSDCSVKTELMNMDTLTWNDGPDFPFTS